MLETMQITDKEKHDYFLDITGEICPMTFVRTKLLLETMKPGETAMLRLQGEEPLGNVPRNLQDHGETIISLTPEHDTDAPFGPHLLVLRKS